MRWSALLLLLLPSVALADRVCTRGANRCLVQVETDARGVRVIHDAPDGLGPPDFAAAYGIPVAADPGATVAIIEAYGYALIESDLAAYRAAFGLPPCTIASGCLTVVNQLGQATSLPPPSPPTSDNWELETALDLDMVSAGCPTCRILVVEADSENNDNLEIANDIAAALGATTISNSWEGPENPAADRHYAHPGVATFAASGDHGEGAPARYPAASPAVIAVGGTLLTPSSQIRGWAEAVWASSGSACSAVTPKPAWQPDTGCAMRHVPDLVAAADGMRGIATFNEGHWLRVNGTSASSPLVAAIYALTSHASEAAPFAYAHPELFFDVQEGVNGTCGDACTATSGWDDASGLGSPNAAAMTGATPPAISVDPPDGGVVNEGFMVTVTCTPTDGSEVKRVLVSVDNFVLGSLTHAPYRQPVPANFVGSGMHFVLASCATTSLMTASVIASVQVCVRAGDCPTPPDTLPDGDCNAGGAAPLWVLLVLRARRRSRARG